jgi:hypothetical protein
VLYGCPLVLRPGQDARLGLLTSTRSNDAAVKSMKANAQSRVNSQPSSGPTGAERSVASHTRGHSQLRSRQHPMLARLVGTGATATVAHDRDSISQAGSPGQGSAMLGSPPPHSRATEMYVGARHGLAWALYLACASGCWHAAPMCLAASLPSRVFVRGVVVVVCVCVGGSFL